MAIIRYPDPTMSYNTGVLCLPVGAGTLRLKTLADSTSTNKVYATVIQVIPINLSNTD